MDVIGEWNEKCIHSIWRSTWKSTWRWWNDNVPDWLRTKRGWNRNSRINGKGSTIRRTDCDKWSPYWMGCSKINGTEWMDITDIGHRTEKNRNWFCMNRKLRVKGARTMTIMDRTSSGYRGKGEWNWLNYRMKRLQWFQSTDFDCLWLTFLELVECHNVEFWL